MAILYPGSIDDNTTLPQPGSGSFTNAPSHAGLHDNEILAIQALEAKLGLSVSTPVSGNLLIATGTGTSTWSKAAPVGAIVGTTDTQPLNNKTLGSAILNSPIINNGGAISLPTITDTLVGRTTTDTLTNKSIVSSTNIVSAVTFTNPYKFRVYRSAALTTGSGTVLVPMDSKTYDTSSNVDVITNKGRFTAPVAGFYMFTASYNLTSGGALQAAAVLSKNGTQVSVGTQNQPTSSTPLGIIVTDTLQLIAGDYVEPFVFNNAGTPLNPGSSNCYFTGILMSTT